LDVGEGGEWRSIAYNIGLIEEKSFHRCSGPDQRSVEEDEDEDNGTGLESIKKFL
jgi:hypothetical protein